VDEWVMQPLLEALPGLLARHLVIVAAVQDPGVAGLARVSPTDSTQVYAKAAAAAAIAARDRAGAVLAAMGADVVDAAAGRLAGRVTDRYLRIKSRGTL